MRVEVIYFSSTKNKLNEDSLLLNDEVLINKKMSNTGKKEFFQERILLAISDGMNNHPNGQVASREILNFLERNTPHLLLGIPITNILYELQKYLEDMGLNKERYYSMGGTVAGIYLEKEIMHIFSIGDTRVYRLGNKKFRKETEDHSIAEELHKKGIITSEEMCTHDQNRHLTSALMASPREHIEIYYKKLLVEETKLLICTDGVWKNIKRREWESEGDMKEFSAKLIDLYNERQVVEDYSFIILNIEEL